MKSETVVQREICDWLAERNFFFWRNNNIPVFGRALPKYTPRGLPDIFVVHMGTVFALEVKRPSVEGEREANGRQVREGQLSLQQAAWGIKFEENGGSFYCVRSVQEVKDIFFAHS